MKTGHFLTLAGLFFAVAALPAHAGQLTSDIVGRVVDANGSPVPGAVMVVKHLETGRVTRHVSGSTGRWHALNVRPDGTYRLSCHAPGEAEPVIRFQGRVALGQTHTRNCVVGTLTAASPAWLRGWAWRQGPSERYAVQRRK